MKSFKEYLTEVHFTDYYHQNFADMRKRYMKLAKNVPSDMPDILKQHENVSYLYVNFTNTVDNTLDRNPFPSPDHSDPMGVYGYPMDYVLKNPADIWYGNNAKYVRVLKSKSRNKTLRLQDMTEGDAIRLLGKIYGTDKGGEVYNQSRLWLKKWGRNIVSDGAVFFFAVQHDFNIAPTKDEGSWTPKKPIYTIRKPLEQNKLLLKLNYIAVLDDAKTAKRAIINPREPEQIIFLRRDAFETVEVIDMNSKAKYLRNTTEPEKIERKLVAQIATDMGDRLREGPERSGLVGWSYYWTKNGNRIEIDFNRPESYYTNKKMGEKKHKEAKLSDAYNYEVKVHTKLGDLHHTFDSNIKFKDAAKEIKSEYDRLTATPEQTDWVPENRKEFLEKQKQAHLDYFKKQKEKGHSMAKGNLD